MKKLLAGLLSFLFVGCGGNPYQVQGDKVIFRHTTKMGLAKRVLEGADPSTFESLSNLHARDARRAYYRWEPIPDADAASLEVVKGQYSRDKSRVFLRTEELKGAEPGSFQVLDEPYSTDRERVYYQASLLSEDAANFEVMIEPFSRDSEAVYIHAKTLAEADPKSFKVLRRGSGFAHDAQHVFWFDTRLEGAESASFRALSRHYAVDENQVFHRKKKLEADPASFEALSEDIGRDQTSAFFRGKLMEGAHAPSLVLLKYSYSADQEQVFHNGRVISGADRASFQVDESKSGQARDANQRYINGKALPL